jgi:hypothetical protein
MICSCARGKKSRLRQRANRDRICCARLFTISKRGRYASRVLRESGSGEILTEAGTPTPISFASNSFASQDMLTDPYSLSVDQEFYAVRIGAGGTTISTSPVATSYTTPDISHAPGNAGIARSAATSRAIAARGSVTDFFLSSPSGI